MILPEGFQFSQSSLQDYINCPRRFELRNLQKLKWPAPLTEPFLEFEQSQVMGQLFHRMVHQYILEIPMELILPSNSSPRLSQWWETFHASFSNNEFPKVRFPEQRIFTTINGYRVMGQIDLLVLEQYGKVRIYDWKTSLQRTPTNRLYRHVQTRLYPLLLIEAGQAYNNGRRFSPDQIEMIYWFTEFPNDPEIIIYNEEKYISDRDFITALILEINLQPDCDFPMTEDERNCDFCNFRSYCNKGTKPGNWITNFEDMWDSSQSVFQMDFDQISEVEF